MVVSYSSEIQKKYIWLSETIDIFQFVVFFKSTRLNQQRNWIFETLLILNHVQKYLQN